jgi:hypothetical protein
MQRKAITSAETNFALFQKALVFFLVTFFLTGSVRIACLFIFWNKEEIDHRLPGERDQLLAVKNIYAIT